jgi:hypothetical protein
MKRFPDLPEPDDFSEEATALRVSAFIKAVAALMEETGIVIVHYHGRPSYEFDRRDSKGEIDHIHKAMIERAFAQFGHLLPPADVAFAEREGI